MAAEYFTRTGVLERGWTKSLMERWLGPPDDVRAHSAHRHKGVLHLFLKDRVLSAEGLAGWREQHAKVERARDARRLGGVRSVRTRRRNIEERAALGVVPMGFND